MISNRRIALLGAAALAVPSLAKAAGGTNYQPQIDALNARVTQEVADRQNADANLQTQINSLSGGTGYGVYVQPTGGDDTTMLMNAINSIPEFRGPPLYLKPGIYNASLPINRRGLVMIGLGHRIQGPGPAALEVGAVIKATNGWAVTLAPATPGTNEYRGCRLSNITFAGGSTTLGGLLVKQSYCLIDNCGAYGHANGIGAKFMYDSGGVADSAQLNILRDFAASDCLTALQLGDPGMTGGVQTLVDNLTSLGSATGGTGTGALVYDWGSQFTGGKIEGHARGVWSRARFGTSVVNMRFENNATTDIDLDRESGQPSGSNNYIAVPWCNVRCGPNQVFDVIDGPVTLTNFGTATYFNGTRLN